MSYSYTDISKNNELLDLMAGISERSVRLLAMDFEGEFNLHVYGERLCLIQVYDGEAFYLVDPAGIDPAILGRFLTMKNVVYLFYSADSDRSLVYKTLGIKMLNVLDLQLMVDVLDLPKKGLDAVLLSELGVEVTGKKRYQRHNWLIRPVEEGAKQYALGDVAYLFDLHRILLEKIQSASLLEELVIKMAGSTKDFDKKSIPGIFKNPAYKKMNKTDKATYEKIVDIREKVAKELDLPAHMVIPKQELVNLTRDPNGIRRLRFGSKVPRRMQDQLVEKVASLND